MAELCANEFIYSSNESIGAHQAYNTIENDQTLCKNRDRLVDRSVVIEVSDELG
jgi:hypothetical protein